MVGCAGSPVCIEHVDVTLTRSKVKVSLLRQCAADSSKLTVDYDSMGPGYSMLEPGLSISLPVGGRVTSKFAKC